MNTFVGKTPELWTGAYSYHWYLENLYGLNFQILEMPSYAEAFWFVI